MSDRLGDKPLFVLLGATASLAGILLFATGKDLPKLLGTSGKNSSEPVLTTAPPVQARLTATDGLAPNVAASDRRTTVADTSDPTPTTASDSSLAAEQPSILSAIASGRAGEAAGTLAPSAPQDADLIGFWTGKATIRLSTGAITAYSVELNVVPGPVGVGGWMRVESIVPLGACATIVLINPINHNIVRITDQQFLESTIPCSLEWYDMVWSPGRLHGRHLSDGNVREIELQRQSSEPILPNR